MNQRFMIDKAEPLTGKSRTQGRDQLSPTEDVDTFNDIYICVIIR